MQDDLLIDEHEKKVVGAKQSRRVIKDGMAKAAYIAEDADESVRLPLVSLCGEYGVPVKMVSTMKKLGTMSGIQIGAAVTVILK